MKNNEAITQLQILIRGNLEQNKMPRTKVEAFLAEFPWVKDYASGPINQVHVSRVTPELTKYEPQNMIVACNALSDTYSHEKIFFVDADGRRVDLVREEKYIARKYILFGRRVEKQRCNHEVIGLISCEGTSVYSCLRSLEERAEAVRFLVSYFGYTGALIIYKVPAGVTLPAWIEQQTDAERSAIQQECQAIDAEVATK
jgi:hypothetical protein